MFALSSGISGVSFDLQEIDTAIEKFKKEFGRAGAAMLPEDRASLVAVYDRMLQRRARRKRQYFYDTASDDLIAAPSPPRSAKNLNMKGRLNETSPTR